jgi:hypothetical protein
MGANFDKKNRVTKELALLVIPLLAAYIFVVFFEAGYASFFGIPFELLSVKWIDIFLANRFTLIVAVVAFLWIGLYYNFLPSASSPVFKGMVTLIFFLCLSFGFMFGQNKAKNQSEYLTLETTPKQVVLKMSRKYSITAQLDTLNNVILRKYQIHELGKDSSLVFKLENIGPLKME